MKKRLFQSFLFICSLATAFAQAPINDECESAIIISDPTSFCSGFGAYTNVGATASAYEDPVCFEANNDVWFSFTAVASSVVVTINGDSFESPGGTLVAPSVALYSGFCGGTISQLECLQDNSSDFVRIRQDGVIVGSNLLIRVDGLGAFAGTFELCVYNFNPPVDPQSDCPEASILCDKSSFTVDYLEGAGFDDTELDDAPCFFNGITGVGEEFNSVWFKWTCDQSGTLTFILTPLRQVDDLDFVLFELPNGIEDCSNKEILRCEAAGEDPNNFPTPCHGPTGLSFDAQDTNENAGCNEGQDNFIAAVNMVSGRSYALAINNFGPGNEGFKIDFGGSGTFLGPKPNFIADPPTIPCLETVQFIDASTFANGDIVSWSWNFGQDAVPQTANGIGPHDVTYNGFGEKFITLTVESDEGCLVTEAIPFEVTECCLPSLDDLGIDVVNTQDIVCNGDSTGLIFVTGTQGTPYYLYSNNGSPFQGSPSFLGLAAGQYEILVVDRLGCEETIQVTLNEPPPIIVDAGPDITVNLGEMTDLNGSYIPVSIGDTIIWSPDSLMNCQNCLDPEVLPAGTTAYELMVENEDGCFDVDSVIVYVTDFRPLFIPNAFSPNFDGTNDLFNIHSGPAVDRVESMEIYDRWGNMVYRGKNLQPNNPSEGWDGTFRGKQMNPGVFAYVIHVRFIDNVVLLYEGDVTLVR